MPEISDFPSDETSPFDRIIDRIGTNSMAQHGFRNYLFKGEEIHLQHDEKDLLTMWVADMSFASPKAATDAMKKRIDHGIFGYTAVFDDAYYQAFNGWTEKRYGWSFDNATLKLSSGVVPALLSLVGIMCGEDEQVLTLTPAYGFFNHAATYNQKTLVTSPLLAKDGKYELDVDDFRAKAAHTKTKLFILCNPHNPTGRVWSETELRVMADICFENDVLIISDEVHSDLLRQGNQHIPLSKLYPESHSIVTCLAPSKTFNLAGMQVANIIIPDPELREKWSQRNLPVVNPVSLAAAQGVYENGEAWLDELREYLDENFLVLSRHLKQHLPNAGFTIPEATYLAWIDLSAYFSSPMNLTKFFIENAGVILEGGEMFVDNAENKIRLNVACPRSTLIQCLKRMTQAISEIKPQ